MDNPKRVLPSAEVELSVCHTHELTFYLQSLGESNTLKSNANIISGQNTGTPSSVGVVSVSGVGGASLGGNNSGSNSITGNTGLSAGNVVSGNNTTVSVRRICYNHRMEE